MKILIDMNLSPDWTAPLRDAGFEADHWSHVGDPKASDRAIMSYARRPVSFTFAQETSLPSH